MLPCETCHADCCGPVPLSPARLRKIERFVRSITPADRQRLASQTRTQVDCGFLDMETHKCAIYPVRPEMCQVYGLTKGLQCPHVEVLITEISPAGTELRMKAEYRTGTATLSSEWRW